MTEKIVQLLLIGRRISREEIALIYFQSSLNTKRILQALKDHKKRYIIKYSEINSTLSELPQKLAELTKNNRC